MSSRCKSPTVQVSVESEHLDPGCRAAAASQRDHCADAQFPGDPGQQVIINAIASSVAPITSLVVM